MNKFVFGALAVAATGILGYVGYTQYQHNQKVKAARAAWEDEMYDPQNPWSKRRNANK